MYNNKKICVVVPAYNEQILIIRVLETMPDYVDLIIVVDDASTDKTSQILSNYAGKNKKTIKIITHGKNQGVGATILTGYLDAVSQAMDIVAVMAGDAQMDPAELERVLLPVVNNEADYVKGNRYFSGEAWKVMPRVRFFAVACLSFVTKIISGYWHVADSQCGFTAISSSAINKLDHDAIYKRYGFPNDILTMLNIASLRVKDVPVKPIYRVGEISGIKYERIVFTLSFLLFKLFWYRLWQKYVIRDFHPLVMFYLFGVIFSAVGIIFGFSMFFIRSSLTVSMVVFCSLLLISGLQFSLFAMWFDMEYNRPLCVK